VPSNELNNKNNEQLNPLALAILYTGKELSVGQQKFVRAIISRDPADRQLVAKVLRKGGKTFCVALAFATLFFNDPTLRIFHLSGSHLQASRLYDYLLPILLTPGLYHLVGQPTKYLVRFEEGGRLEVSTASAKSVRGADVDILSFDEAVMIPQPLIDAAWPLVRASKFAKRIITSTASPEVSLDWFLRLWQNAHALKFDRHEWPLSECPWISKEDTAEARLMLDSRTFAVEYEGKIAEARGAVWGSHLIDGCLVDANNRSLYPLPAPDPLTEKWCGLDWGFIGQTFLTFWEKQGDLKILRKVRIWSETPYTQVKQEIVADYGNYPIYPDSEAVSDNADLKDMGMDVRPRGPKGTLGVIFSKDKDFLISRARWNFEKNLFRIPDPDKSDDPDLFTFVQQLKAYHYNEATGKPEKKNDHGCDSLICAMKHVEQDTPYGKGKLPQMRSFGFR